MVRSRSRRTGGNRDPREGALTPQGRGIGLALVALALLATLAGLLPAGASAQGVGEDDERHPQHATTIDTPEAKALAERFVPIVMLRVRESECSDYGEPYLPIPVDLVLDNPDVELRQNAGGNRADDPVLMTAPAAEDLAQAPADTYLDYPGNARDPQCTYEKWYHRSMDGHVPTVYARVAASDTGEVVVQYHLFYVFNDFNNTHESDWEMVQLRFDVPTVAEALEAEPAQVAFAQRGGGETASWDDDKLRREGDHVLVHAAQGSHASQYGTETYIGWGANGTGFGCDDTQDPVYRVDVAPVLMTADPTTPGSDQAWLAWRGRWGERQPREYNGPLGPATTYRWADPVGWQAGLRDSSILVPGTSAFGPGPTDVFCDLTEFGSRMLTLWAVEPGTVIALVAIPLVFFTSLLLLARKTIGASLRLYRRHRPIFAALGLLLIPIGIVANGLRYLVVSYPPGREVVEVMRFSPASDLAAALTVGGVQHIASLLVIVPAVLTVFREIEHGRRPTFRGVMRGTFARIALIVRAMARPWAIIFLLAISVIGLPWAVQRAGRWGFTPHAVLLDDVPPDAAPQHSAEAVRGRWWRTAGTDAALTILGAMPGPVLGIALMVTMAAGVDFVNGLSSLVYAAVLPFSILGSAVLYRRRQGRALPAAAHPDGIAGSTAERLRPAAP
jgi:hypothetical protein